MGKGPNLTPEQREARRAMIQQTKPWLKATGPKTEEGKARSAQRWRRHGMRTEEMQVAKKWVRSLFALTRALRRG